MKNVALIVLVFMFPFLSLAQAWSEDDPLMDNTKAAEERVQQWDVEAKKIEKRGSWEIPIVSALTFVGFIFYAAGPKGGLIATGVAATGLTFYFWPSRHHRPRDAD